MMDVYGFGYYIADRSNDHLYSVCGNHRGRTALKFEFRLNCTDPVIVSRAFPVFPF